MLFLSLLLIAVCQTGADYQPSQPVPASVPSAPTPSNLPNSPNSPSQPSPAQGQSHTSQQSGFNQGTPIASGAWQYQGYQEYPQQYDNYYQQPQAAFDPAGPAVTVAHGPWVTGNFFLPRLTKEH